MKKTMLTTATILISALITGTVCAKDIKDIVPEVVQAASDSTVVHFVARQNAMRVSLDKIKEIDKKWKSAKKPTDFMNSFITNAAARVLATIEKSKPYFLEFILTDNKGANVAITGMTSDFWQGDEPKFTNAFAEGRGSTYIARPQRDKSTGEVISQVSVPVKKGGRAIGTLTVGVRVNKL